MNWTKLKQAVAALVGRTPTPATVSPAQTPFVPDKPFVSASCAPELVLDLAVTEKLMVGKNYTDGKGWYVNLIAVEDGNAVFRTYESYETVVDERMNAAVFASVFRPALSYKHKLVNVNASLATPSDMLVENCSTQPLSVGRQYTDGKGWYVKLTAVENSIVFYRTHNTDEDEIMNKEAFASIFQFVLSSKLKPN